MSRQPDARRGARPAVLAPLVRRLAGPPELRSRTARISADLARAGIRHAVSGAVAMTAHGVGRSTFDIDILVVAPAVRLPEAFAAIRRHGFAGDDRTLVTRGDPARGRPARAESCRLDPDVRSR